MDRKRSEASKRRKQRKKEAQKSLMGTQQYLKEFYFNNHPACDIFFRDQEKYSQILAQNTIELTKNGIEIKRTRKQKQNQAIQHRDIFQADEKQYEMLKEFGVPNSFTILLPGSRSAMFEKNKRLEKQREKAQQQKPDHSPKQNILQMEEIQEELQSQ